MATDIPLSLMRMALALLDRAGQGRTLRAARLQHALDTPLGSTRDDGERPNMANDGTKGSRADRIKAALALVDRAICLIELEGKEGAAIAADLERIVDRTRADTDNQVVR